MMKTKHTKKQIRSWSRAVSIVTRAAFFFAFPAAWSTGFSGVKYVLGQIGAGQPLEMTAFLKVFCALALFTIIFGRFFCGRACAFGTYGDVLYALVSAATKKCGRKPPHISKKLTYLLRFVKYLVLIAVCLLCFFGLGAQLAAGSPWTAFSQIISRKIHAEGVLGITSLVLFVLCTAGMCLEKRFFCRFLCPFGAVFSILPVMPFSAVSRRKSACIRGCRACKNACPAGLDLAYTDEKNVSPEEQLTQSEHSFAAHMGECIQCGKCTYACPKDNAGSITMPGGLCGIIFDIVKSIALFILFLWLL